MAATTGMTTERTSERADTSEVRSAYDWVSDTAQANPALVVGGALAVGALAAVVLLSRKPQSRARTVEKRIARELRSVEQALVRQRPISALSDRLADASGAVASSMSSLDMDAVRGLLGRIGHLSSQFARRGGW